MEWPNVGYYSEETDKLNDFELLLVNRSDVSPGDFDVVFNYDQVQWETGAASGGSDGLGGTSAAVGFSAGNGNASDSYQLIGSLENGAFLDSNPSTGLADHDLNSTVPGRYIFHINGGTGDTGGLNGLYHQWPTGGLGYSFANATLTHFLSDSALPVDGSTVLTPSTMENTFSDWTQVTGSSAEQQAQLNWLLSETSRGICYGLALSGGRFDAGLANLYDPSAGRSDVVWTSDGDGIPGTLALPEPGKAGSDPLYDNQFLTRVAEDFESQWSEESLASRDAQHFAYSDPTTGTIALEQQLESVMSSGTNLYPPPQGPSLSTQGGNGYAMILLQADNNTRYGTEMLGHAVLAYSAELAGDGDLQIDVWDNDHPGQHYAIDVRPDGEWTYNAPDGIFGGVLSMNGQPGDAEGIITVLPLYDPVGLHYDPNYAPSGATASTLGDGSYVDVPAGDTISSETDSAGDPVDVEANAADDSDGDDGGAVVDFPSGDGSLTVTGPDSSINVRSSDALMQAQSVDTSEQQQLTYDAKPDQGSISASGATTQLTVSRGGSEAVSTGAGL